MEAQSFGYWLKQRRRVLGLTQAGLADRIGCATVTIKKLEADERRPSFPICERLAMALGVPDDQRPALFRWALDLVEPAVPQGATPTLAPAPASVLAPQRSIPPRALTSLVGRDQELAQASELLCGGAVWLLTLVGPPGVGKTRLALELAQRLHGVFAHGACFVRLAAISDPELVPLTIAQALGLEVGAGQTALAALRATLSQRELLLVCDNFEHLLPAAPLLVDLLEAAPGLKVLVTSQEVLHLGGEQVFRLAPLPAPTPEASPQPAALASVPAVELFVARARAARHDFALTEANAAAVAELCACLDGLPLAIELAAAQSAVYQPAALLQQIGQRLHQLAYGSRSASARHQTLRGAIGWSYGLLTSEEQTCLRRLAVFVGGWSLEAAAELCALGQVELSERTVALADKSLVTPDPQARLAPRFALLQTIRAYAYEQLEQQGEHEALRARHAAYFLKLAETAAPQLAGADQQHWLARLEDEHPNLRAALDWALEQGQSEQALRLAGALWIFWRQRSYQSEGRVWLDRALAQGQDARPLWRGRALLGAGWIAYDEGNSACAVERFRAAQEAFAAAGDQRGQAQALHGLGELTQLQGDYGVAEALFAESLVILRDLDDAEETAWTLDHLGRLALYQGGYARASDLLAEALEIFQTQGQRWGMAYALDNLGIAALAQAELDTARLRFQAGHQLHQAIGDQKGLALALCHQGQVAFFLGDLAEARRLFGTSLELSRQFSYRWCEAMALEGLGRVATKQGLPAEAAQHLDTCLELLVLQHAPPGRSVAALDAVVALLAPFDPAAASAVAGAVAGLRETLRLPQPPLERAEHEQVLAALRSDSGSAEAWAAGLGWSIDRVIGVARTGLQALAESGEVWRGSQPLQENPLRTL
ncbi:MAG: hypothetical protein OHK0022_25630 [Roseiflexaceae bacterium]